MYRRYFQRSSPDHRYCPFGKDCFYQHQNADGTPYVFKYGVDHYMRVCPFLLGLLRRLTYALQQRRFRENRNIRMGIPDSTMPLLQEMQATMESLRATLDDEELDAFNFAEAVQDTFEDLDSTNSLLRRLVSGILLWSYQYHFEGISRLMSCRCSLTHRSCG